MRNRRTPYLVVIDMSSNAGVNAYDPQGGGVHAEIHVRLVGFVSPDGTRIPQLGFVHRSFVALFSMELIVAEVDHETGEHVVPVVISRDRINVFRVVPIRACRISPDNGGNGQRGRRRRCR